MTFTVEIKPTAMKELKSLPQYIMKKSILIIDSLSVEPRPEGCKKLVDSKSRWRIRVGDYRILYEIDNQADIVTVFRVAHRKEIYR